MLGVKVERAGGNVKNKACKKAREQPSNFQERKQEANKTSNKNGN